MEIKLCPAGHRKETRGDRCKFRDSGSLRSLQPWPTAEVGTPEEGWAERSTGPQGAGELRSGFSDARGIPTWRPLQVFVLPGSGALCTHNGSGRHLRRSCLPPDGSGRSWKRNRQAPKVTKKRGVSFHEQPLTYNDEIGWMSLTPEDKGSPGPRARPRFQVTQGSSTLMASRLHPESGASGRRERTLSCLSIAPFWPYFKQKATGLTLLCLRGNAADDFGYREHLNCRR